MAQEEASKITVYHCDNARSLRPVWTLLEMGLDFDVVKLPFPPRVFDKSFLDINPLGTVPYFIDGDVRMTESVGICHYLMNRYGPTDLAVSQEESDYASFLDWLYRSDATLTFPQTLVFRYSMLEPPERQNPQIAEDYKKWFFGRLRFLDLALQDREFLCAGRFTIADICVGFALYFAEVLSLSDDFTPAIADYWQRLKSRPHFVDSLTY